MTASFDQLLAKLNPEQKLAVQTTEGPVLVIAGPGTGKTQILAMRIAEILRNPDLQMSASNILCLTFTESGATAMRERLTSIIGSSAYQVRIHTFHSFCNEVIQTHPEIFTARSSLSDIERAELFNQLIDELDASSPLKPFGDPYLYRRNITQCIRELKQEFISAEELAQARIDLDIFVHKAQFVLGQIAGIDLRKKPKPILDDMQSVLEELSVIASGLGISGDIYYKHIYGMFSRAENITEFRDSVRDFTNSAEKNSPRLEELVRVYKRYSEELEARRLYDYEDMILRVIGEFGARPDLLSEYQEQFQYILVDEYQDSNGSQNQIIRLLSSFYQDNPNLFVVGDDDQSIYRFQGASVENIFDFKQRYQANLAEIVLRYNYRSQQNILDAATSTISNNRSRLIADKILESRAGHDLQPVQIISYNNAYEEAYKIAAQIQELLKQDIEPSEIAVLYREHKQSETIGKALQKLGIACTIRGQENIFDNLEILQLIDLFKVIQKPASSNLIFNLLNYEFLRNSDLLKGITQHDVYNTITNYRRSEFKELGFIEYLLNNDKFKAFAQALLGAGHDTSNLSFETFFEKTIRGFGYLEFILSGAQRISGINNLSALFNEIKKLEQSGSPLKASKVRHAVNNDTGTRFDLEDFIYFIDTAIENGVKIDSKPISSNQGTVQLMSAHAAKGLEFDYVFIYSCIDKSWGNKADVSRIKLPVALSARTSSAQLTEDSYEDERRLFYVALTRARKLATISYHRKNSNAKDVSPSMFIAELNNKHCNLQHSENQSETELEILKSQFTPVDNKDNILSLEHDFIAELLSNYKLSVTHLNNYLKCPRLFFYQNLLRVPAAKTKHACFGTAVHGALFDLGTRIRTGSTNAELDLKLLLIDFEKRLEKENLSQQDYSDSLEYGRTVLTEYFKHYQTELYANKNILLEYNFGFQGLNYEGIELEGKLDKIEIVNDKAIVVDYKTGNPATKSSSLKPDGDYHRQIVFYKLLVDLACRSGQFKYEMSKGEIDFVQPDSSNNFKKQTIIVNDEDVNNLKNTIVDVVGKIKAQNFDKTEVLKTCDRCDFAKVCGRA